MIRKKPGIARLFSVLLLACLERSLLRCFSVRSGESPSGASSALQLHGRSRGGSGTGRDPGLRQIRPVQDQEQPGIARLFSVLPLAHVERSLLRCFSVRSGESPSGASSALQLLGRPRNGSGAGRDPGLRQIRPVQDQEQPSIAPLFSVLPLAYVERSLLRCFSVRSGESPSGASSALHEKGRIWLTELTVPPRHAAPDTD
jgi:hypothetical protein